MIKDPICNMQVSRDAAVTLEHKGQTVYFCSEGCRDTFLQQSDTKEIRHDHKLIIIGGGNSAMQILDNLVTVARRVQIVSNLPLRKTADAKDVERLLGRRNVTAYEGYKVEEIRGSGIVEEVVIRQLASDTSRTLPAGGVFIAVGMHPNSAIAADMVELNERAEVKIAPDCATSMPGLFAAGDVTDAYGKRIIIAAGEGGKAALAARQYLLNQRKQRSKTS